MSNWEFWQSVMGNSDDDEDDVFEGFTLEEITKKDESDIDLDIVVNYDEQMSSDTDSGDDVGEVDSVGQVDSDLDLPILAPRKKKRLSKTPTTHWTDSLSDVKPAEFDLGTTAVGPDHTLPPDAGLFLSADPRRVLDPSCH